MAKRKPKKTHSRTVKLAELPEGWTSWDGLEEGTVVDGSAIVEDDSGRLSVELRRAKVLRLKVPRALQAMTVEQRAGMLEYARAIETCGATSGALASLSGGGSRSRFAGSPPNLAKLEAAERLRAFHKAMDGRVMTDVNGTTGKAVVTTVQLRQIAHWVAVDHLTRADIARRLGFDPDRTGAIAIATREAADLLAACCGYLPSDPGFPQIRNAPGLVA